MDFLAIHSSAHLLHINNLQLDTCLLVTALDPCPVAWFALLCTVKIYLYKDFKSGPSCLKAD